MKHSTKTTLSACVLVVCITGCKQYQQPDTQTSGPSNTGATAATAPPAAVNQSGADLGVSNSSQHGKYLVDATGKTVYTLQKDSKGMSSCYDACATQWPPLLSPQGTPKALDRSIAQNAIVNIQRTDGGVQVTYHGHPLYHYSQDVSAGQINGQGAKDPFGEWYMLSPSGDPIGR
jgi:predicted lipoprotein with Yx(FWY)xxD motif